jgi:hypothetical protein
MERLRDTESEEREPAVQARPAPVPQPSTAAVLALQRSAGNQYVNRLLARAPATAAVDPVPALNAIEAWRVPARAVIDGATAWQTGNWIEYLSRTSSNPQLSLADSDIADVTANFVGNVLTEVGGEAIEKAGQWTAATLGAAIGTAAEPGLGTVIGFLIGVLVESVASYIFAEATGKADAGEKAADAAERVGRLIGKQHALLAAQEAVAARELEALVAAMRERALGAQSQDEIDAVAAWAKAAVPKTVPPKPGPPHPLAEEMLKVWVLEHAGDLDTAHGDTDSTQWERALQSVFGEDGLQGMPSLFAYQTRHEWGRAGIDHASTSAEVLSEAEALMGEHGIVSGDMRTILAADPVQKAFHGRKFSFRGAGDPQAMLRYLVDHTAADPIDPEWVLAQLEAGALTVTCELDVRSTGESAVIDEWVWRFEFDQTPPVEEPGGAGGIERPPADTGGGPDGPYAVEFVVWPTWE